MTAKEAEVILRGGDPLLLDDALKQLPPDVDPQLASAILAKQFDGPSVWAFARAYKKLPEPVIRALLVRLERRTNAFSIFLRVYTADAPDLCDAWERGLFRLLSLDTTYAWGSKQKRAKFTELASEPRVVEAIQAAVVANEEARIDALAVLAVDASDASVDALMPHFERAARDKNRKLDRLAMLRKYATATPAMTQMLARVDAMLDERNASSPALDLARHIGLGELKVFWFHKYVGSSTLNRNSVPWYQGHITVDSRESEWLAVSISEVPGSVAGRRLYTSFNAYVLKSDTLELGRCTPQELPQWLAASAKKLNFAWDFGEVGGRSNVRGAKRERITQWLQEGA